MILSEEDLKLVCGSCFEKLSEFYDYYKFVLHNQTKNLIGSDITIKDETKSSECDEEPFEEGSFAKETDTDSEMHDEVRDPASSPALELKQEQGDLIGQDLILACELCPSMGAFPTFSAFQTHSQTVHNIVGTIMCCNKKFKNQRSLTRHVLNHKNETLSSKLTRPSLQEQAGRTQEREKLISRYLILTCEQCPKRERFKNYQSLWDHTKSEHGSVLKLHCCGRPWQNRFALARHLKQWHEGVESGPRLPCDTIPTCEKCGQTFRTNRTLQSHLKLAHAKCEYCNLDLRQRHLKPIDIWSHIQQHLLSDDITKPAPYVCDICNKQVANRVRLKGHMYNQHILTEKEENFVCHQCGDRFKLQGKYNEHMKEKHSIGGFKAPCPICGLMLRNNERALKAHMQNVHSPTPTICPVCETLYPTKNAMKVHYARCHAEKKYACTYCTKRFGIKQSLIDHEATHLGVNLYHCNYCTSEYKSQGNMASHMRKIHPDEYEKEKKEKKLKRYMSI